MLAVYDVNTTTEYIHPQDKTEPKTVWHIGVLDAKAHAFVTNAFTNLSWKASGEVDPITKKPVMEPNVTVDRSNKQVELVKLGLKGVVNFPVKLVYVEEKYPFGTRTVLDDASLNAIKPYIEALAAEIERNSTVTADDEKK